MEDEYEGLGVVDDLNNTSKDYLLDQEAKNTGFTDSVGKAFTSGDNIAVQLWNDVSRKVQTDADPAWDTTAKEHWISQNKAYVPDNQHWRYFQTQSKAEADMLRNDAVTQRADSDILARREGISTFAAQMLAGIIDIDAPLTAISGGTSLLARSGYATTKLGRTALGAVAGARTGATLGALSNAANPNGDWSEIISGGLSGLAFGALARGTVEWRANELADAVRTEYGETLAEGAPFAKRNPDAGIQPTDDAWGYQARAQAAQEAEEAAEASKVAGKDETPASGGPSRSPEVLRDWQEVEPEDTAPDVPSRIGSEIQSEGTSTVGARSSAPRNGPGIASIASTKITDVITAAKSRLQALDLEGDYYSAFDKLKNKNGAIGKAAERFHQVLQNVGLISDFERMFRSNSSVAKVLAYDLLEQPIGAIVNNRSAANLQDVYNKRLQATYALDHEDAFNDWAVRTQNAGFLDRTFKQSMREQFDRMVIGELEARKNEGKKLHPDPAVQKAADAIDRATAEEVVILKGKQGEAGWHGTENLKPTMGYFPHRWSGRKINELLRSGRATLDEIYKGVAVSIKSAIPNATQKDALIWAKAIIDHARQVEEGFNTNLIAVLQGDGAKALEDLLRRNNVPEIEAKNLIDNLQFAGNERNRPGFTKERLDLDLRDQVKDFQLLDLVDTDIQKVLGARFRRSAGMGALARKDITSTGQIDDLIRAIKEEQAAVGKAPVSGIDERLDADREISEAEIRHIFDYFLGRPTETEIGPFVHRIRKATNLALLNTLGMTNLAEFATTAASVGYKDFLTLAPKELRDALKNTDSELFKELKHFNIFVPEERIFRDDLTFATEAARPDSELLSKLDNLLNKAQRVQGYTSAFYHTRRMQQRMAVTLGSDKIMRMLKEGTDADRLNLIGISPSIAKRFKQYIDNGTVEWQDGYLRKLNLDKWDPDDAMDFTLVMNRVTNQQAQKAMHGESNQLFQRNGIAGLFVHLKSFSLLAMEKQFLKHARMADSEAMALATYGLMFAGTVYTARQLMSGNTEYLGPTDVLKGAISYSNMLGWFPMMADPVASILGMDNFRFYNFGVPTGRAGDVLAAPAFLDVGNRLARLPGAINDVVSGTSDTDTIRSFQALPIIGNAYGMNYMWNSLKDSIKAQKKQRNLREDAYNALSEETDMRNLFDLPTLPQMLGSGE